MSLVHDVRVGRYVTQEITFLAFINHHDKTIQTKWITIYKLQPTITKPFKPAKGKGQFFRRGPLG